MKGLANISAVLVVLGLLWQSDWLQQTLKLGPGFTDTRAKGAASGGPVLGPQYDGGAVEPSFAVQVELPPGSVPIRRTVPVVPAAPTAIPAANPATRPTSSAPSASIESPGDTSSSADSPSPAHPLDEPLGKPVAAAGAGNSAAPPAEPSVSEEPEEAIAQGAAEENDEAPVGEPVKATVSPIPPPAMAESPIVDKEIRQPYTIHIASYLANSEWGAKALAKTRLQEPDAFLSPVSVKGRLYVRLLLGHFADKKDARQSLERRLAEGRIPEGSVLRLRYAVATGEAGDCGAMRQKVGGFAERGFYLSPQETGPGRCRLLAGAFSSAAAAASYLDEAGGAGGEVVER